MSDDTTNWLKKSSDINPLRRSLKTSLRFHVNNSEMDASIITSSENNNPKIFIPRMLGKLIFSN